MLSPQFALGHHSILNSIKYVRVMTSAKWIIISTNMRGI